MNKHFLSFERRKKMYAHAKNRYYYDIICVFTLANRSINRVFLGYVSEFFFENISAHPCGNYLPKC